VHLPLYGIASLEMLLHSGKKCREFSAIYLERFALDDAESKQ
jgi:hypothetical protein